MSLDYESKKQKMRFHCNKLRIDEIELNHSENQNDRLSNNYSVIFIVNITFFLFIDYINEKQLINSQMHLSIKRISTI